MSDSFSSNLSPSEQKRRLRTAIRQKRRELDSDTRTRAGAQAAKLVTEQLSANEQKVALFLSNDGEIDTQPILRALWQQGRRCYLPKIRPLPPARMWFLPYQQNDALRPNRFAILEPDRPVSEAVAASHLDVIFLPLVAFDRNGGRLGMGGGFYDRTLVTLRHSINERSNATHRPRLVGLALAMQQVSEIPMEKWDTPLDAVVTEQEWIDCRQSMA